MITNVTTMGHEFPIYNIKLQIKMHVNTIFILNIL